MIYAGVILSAVACIAFTRLAFLVCRQRGARTMPLADRPEPSRRYEGTHRCGQ